MKAELQKQIVDKCPKLFSYRPEPGAPFLSIVFGMECGDGWFKILDNLCTKLEECINRLPEEAQEYCCASQVKEKYGSLRFYMCSSTDEMEDLISEAEKESTKTCEYCGKPGTIDYDQTWLSCLCEDCKKDK